MRCSFGQDDHISRANSGVAVESRDGSPFAKLVSVSHQLRAESLFARRDLHEEFFAGLHTLMDALAGAKLLGDTVVVVASEMGRTPRLNSAEGKDHWPVTSALVLGAGVRGGQVIGATTDALDAAPVDFDTGAVDEAGRPIAYADFAAGLLQHLGVDPSGYILNGEPLHAISA